MSSIKSHSKWIGVLGLSLCFCLAAGCERQESGTGAEEMSGTRPDRARDMVARAEGRVETLTVEAVARERAGGAVIVDLRETEERLAHGAIPGAIHVPRGMLEFWADPTSPVHRPEFDPSRRYILHCAGGGRSALAVATLEDMGYTNVAHLGGGFEAWRAAGMPTESITTPVPR
jgi:rhodanese-related sulfurtransferase